MFEAIEIYSIGDGLFVHRVLTGLAMLHESGSIAGMAMIGMMLGIFVAVIKGVMTAGAAVDFKYPMIAFCLYSVLFGVTVPVIVIDKVTAPGQTELQVRAPIDHVPIGAAFAGYLISGVGVKITDLMEDAMSVPGSARVTQGGWGRTLETLAAAREIGAGKFMGSDGFPEFRDSNLRYISDCTISGMQLDPTQAQRMQADPDPWKGIEYPSKFLTTETRLNADGSARSTPETIPCSDAMGRLQAAAGATLPKSFGEYIDARYGGANGISAMEDALSSIGVSSAVRAQDYMAASMQAALLSEAVLKGPMTASQNSATILIQQASEQRRTQWAAEETMLKRVLQPTIGFFEAMLYAVVPFAVFAIGLGPFGLNLAMKYMILALWVQLFMPILAVVNLFQLTAMEHFVNAQMLGNGSNPLTSIHGSWAMQEKALDWLSFGATIAAAVPSLALFLLFGGAVAATAMAGRLQGGDHVDEKQMSPDAVRNGPVQEVASVSQFDRVGGNLATGGAPMLTNWSFQNTASSERQSAFSEAAKASQTWSTELGKVLSKGSGLSETSRESLVNAISNDLSSDTQKIGSMGTSHNISMADLYTAARVNEGALSATLGGGFALPKGLFKAGVSGTSSEKESSSAQKTIDYLKSLSAEQRESIAVKFGETVSRSASKNYDKALSLDESNTDSQSFREASSDMQEKSFAYSSIDKVSESATNDQKMNTAVFAEQLIQKYPGGYDALMREGMSAVGGKAFHANKDLAELDQIRDPQHRAVAQMLLTTFGKGPGADELVENTNPALADERRLFNSRLLGTAFTIGANTGNADAHRGIGGDVTSGKSRHQVENQNLQSVSVRGRDSVLHEMDQKNSLLEDPNNPDVGERMRKQVHDADPAVTAFVNQAIENHHASSQAFARSVAVSAYNAGGVANMLSANPQPSAYEGVPSDAYGAKMNGESFSFNDVKTQIRENLENNYPGTFDDKTLDTMSSLGATVHYSETSRSTVDYLNGAKATEVALKEYTPDQRTLMLGYLEGKYHPDALEKSWFNKPQSGVQ